MKAASSPEYSYSYPALREALPKQPPELRVVSVRRGPAAVPLSRQAALIFVAALAMFAMVVYANMRLTELSDEVSQQQQEYQRLLDSSNRMKVQLEEKISLRNVEEYATETLGMSQMESYQVSYVNLGEQNRVEVFMSAKPSLWQAAKDSARALLEYIRR